MSKHSQTVNLTIKELTQTVSSVHW